MFTSNTEFEAMLSTVRRKLAKEAEQKNLVDASADFYVAFNFDRRVKEILEND